MFDSVIKIPKNGCRILQITDIQVIDSAQLRCEGRLYPETVELWDIKNADDLVFNDIDWLVEKTKPDLIIVTGDIVYGEFDDKGTTLALIIEKFERYNLPWLPVWGNHDNESEKGVLWQCEQFENAPNCLFKTGNVTGTGNYTIGIFDGENRLQRVLYMLNSHGSWNACEKSLECGVKRDYGFEPDQIAWIEQTGAEIEAKYGEIPAFACFHTASVDLIEGLEKKGVYDRQMRFETERFVPYKWDNGEEFGEINETFQIVYPSVETLFKKIHVDGVFLGHTHLNTCSIFINGIRWTQGLKTGKYAYHDENLLGGTVIDVSFDDDAFSVYHLYTKDR